MSGRINRVPEKFRGQPRSSDYQSLGQRIKWLRAKQVPYMTQPQLAYLARVPLKTIVLIENGDESALNMKLNTLRRIAHAVGWKVFINIKSRPSPGSGECQLEGPELPPLPKLKRKKTTEGRRLAELNGSWPWKNYHQRRHQRQQKAISDKEGKAEPSGEKVE